MNLKYVWRFLACAGILLLLPLASARAEEGQGRGLLCTTQEEIELFVTLVQDDIPPEEAVGAANKQKPDGVACNTTIFNFSSYIVVKTKHFNGVLVDIIKYHVDTEVGLLGEINVHKDKWGARHVSQRPGQDT